MLLFKQNFQNDVESNEVASSRSGSPDSTAATKMSIDIVVTLDGLLFVKDEAMR